MYETKSRNRRPQKIKEKSVKSEREFVRKRLLRKKIKNGRIGEHFGQLKLLEIPQWPDPIVFFFLLLNVLSLYLLIVLPSFANFLSRNPRLVSF